MIPAATEELRYIYPLNESSVVIDAGGYQGDFAQTIADRYNCHVHVFEPVMRFANAIKNRLANYPKVRVWPCALGGTDRIEVFHVQNNSSGMFAGSEDTETVHVTAIAKVLEWPWVSGFDNVDLLKLNIEGMEFEVLEAVFALQLARRFRHIQVQFHSCVPNAEERHSLLQAQLSFTHEHVYGTPWVWDGYTRRK